MDARLRAPGGRVIGKKHSNEGRSVKAEANSVEEEKEEVEEEMRRSSACSLYPPCPLQKLSMHSVPLATCMACTRGQRRRHK